MVDEYRPDPIRWRILAVLLVSIFMSLISVGIVNVALSSMERGLGATNAQLQWVLSGYALTFGIVLVAAGRAGDIFGRGPLFIAGVGLFTASSVAGGLAPTATWLDVARFVQGIGSGLLNPQALGMIQQHFRGEERGKAFGFFGTAVGVSLATGPLVGGLLIKAAGVDQGWRWTFFVNVPVGCLAIVLALLWFPRPLLKSRTGSADHGRKRRHTFAELDPVGALLLGLAVFAILMPVVQADASGMRWIWVLLPVGLVLAWAWVLWERRFRDHGHEPMVDLGIFRTPSFRNGTLLISLYFLGASSIWVLIALYMQQGLGHSALASGVVGIPNAIASAVTANWGGRVVVRLGRIVVAGGIVTMLAGLGLSILVVQLHQTAGLSEWFLLGSLCILGAGQGAVISPNQTLTLADVPLRYAGSSGGIMQTGQRVGTAVGIAVITAIAFATLSVSSWPQAATVGFAAVAVGVGSALVVAMIDLRMRRRSPEHPTSTTPRS